MRSFIGKMLYYTHTVLNAPARALIALLHLEILRHRQHVDVRVRVGRAAVEVVPVVRRVEQQHGDVGLAAERTMDRSRAVS